MNACNSLGWASPPSTSGEEIVVYKNKCTPTYRPEAHTIDARSQDHSIFDMPNVEEVRASLERMAELPSIDSIIGSLQDCKNQKNPAHAKNMYIYLCDGGLEAQTELASYLVPMFVECGSLPNAQKVFNRLLYPNEYCWTSLMHGYIECGESQHALSLFHKMEEDCVHPSKYTLATLLKASARLKCIGEGLEMHAEIVREGFESDTFVRSTLVNMYAKCGSLVDAREVFDEIPARNVVLWTTLIAGYTENGCDEEALACLEQMQKEGLLPDAVTLVCGLKACGSIGSIERGRLLHTEVAKEGLERDSFVCSTLVDMYAQCGSLVEAQEMFNDLPVRDVFAWSALIAAYAKQGLGEEGLNWLELMRLEGISPDAITFVCSLKACGNIGAMERGQEIHGEILKEGLDNNLSVGNSLVDMYMKCGLIAEAQEVFEKLQGQDVMSWNTLMSGYLEHKLSERVLNCLEQMYLQGVSPNAVTFVCSLKACGFFGAISRAQVIHAMITRLGMERDSSICSTLITLYGECSLLAEAQVVFNRAPVRHAALWSALMAGYTEHRHGDEVLSCLEQMQLEGVSSNVLTFVCSLKASGTIGALDKGREIHSEIAREGFERELFVGNTLVDMYGKSGSLTEAQEVFDELCVPDVVSWTALITAYADHGHDKEALDCFKKMQQDGVCPNAVTYVCSLKASSNIGAIDRGREIHAQVTRKGLGKGLFICSSLMDMYVECGLLVEARAVFDELPVQDLASWNALIGGYAEYGLGEDALSCLKQMQLKGIALDAVTYICSLKACICLGALEEGREIHAEIVKRGFERDFSVGNILLDLYAKYGSALDLCEVFDTLSDRDVISWTALIAGYSEHGLGEKVLACLEQMQVEGVSRNTVTFICSLQACGSAGFVERGQELHAEVVSDGFERDSFVYSCLVDMYCKWGSLAEALDVFDERPVQDVVSWNTLMNGFAEHGLDEEVLTCLQKMQLEGVSPNAVTFTCSLKACGSMGAIEDGQDIHVQIVLGGFEQEAYVGNALMDMYAKCGSFLEAQEMFDMLPVQDVVSWTTLMDGYAENGLGEKALNCLEQMTQDGVLLNAVTLVCSLKACGSIEAIERGQEIHDEIVRKGAEKDPVVCNTLVDMYAKCGLLTEAEDVFDKLPIRDVISWTALVVGYAEQGLSEEVLECFERMRADGVSPDALMFVCSLKACGSMRAIERGRSMHADVAKMGISGDPLVDNAVVNMYAKFGALVEALEVFHKLKRQDVVSWTALIAGYVEHGLGEEALKCLEQMQLEKMVPNFVTYLSSLKACGKVGAIEKGQELLSQIIKEGLEKNFLCGSGLTDGYAKGQSGTLSQINCRADMTKRMLANACVDMFGKCGNMIDAQKVFEVMANRDLVTWNALIMGYARQGESDRVFDLFDKMKEEGIQPDGVTFLGVLNVCSHMGLLYKGQDYLEAMVNESCVAPTIEHLNCLLDLLGRAGQLDEAIEMSEKMPFLPDLATWTTLLGACRNGSDIDLGRQAFECAVRFDENHAATLVLISNICAEVGNFGKE